MVSSAAPRRTTRPRVSSRSRVKGSTASSPVSGRSSPMEASRFSVMVVPAVIVSSTFLKLEHFAVLSKRRKRAKSLFGPTPRQSRPQKRKAPADAGAVFAGCGNEDGIFRLVRVDPEGPAQHGFLGMQAVLGLVE